MIALCACIVFKYTDFSYKYSENIIYHVYRNKSRKFSSTFVRKTDLIHKLLFIMKLVRKFKIVEEGGTNKSCPKREQSII